MHARAVATLILPLVLAGRASDDDLAAALRSKDVAERLAAVATLGTGGVEGAEKLLLKALKDEDWEVVERAAAALGTVGAGASLAPLAQLALAGPCERLRRSAAESLAALDADEGLDAIARKLAGRDALWACAAFARVAPAASEVRAPKSLSKLLRDDDGRLRAAAARALVAAARADRSQVLEGLLRSEHVAVRAAALEAAARDPRPGQEAALARALAAADLAPVVERRALAALVATLAAIEDPAARALAVRSRAAESCGSVAAAVAARGARLVVALGADQRTRAADLLAALAPALEHPDQGARAQAAWALGALEGAVALERARALAAGDPAARVRRAALAVVLRAPGADEGELGAWLARRLESEADAGLREDLAVALGRPELAAGLPALVAALGDAEWGVALCAAVSLGLTRSEAAVAPLRALVEGARDWRLRGAAVVGLTHVLRKEAVPHVIAALADAEPLVARTAHGFLSCLAREELAPEVAAWSAWWRANEARVRLYDPAELEDRRRRYGYVVPPREVYEGLDVLVLESRGDHIQILFDELGIEHRLTAGARVAKDGLDAAGVFVANCTGECEAEDVERLAWFVRAGGYLFGSCWALHETIERIEPGVVRRFETPGEVLDDVLASPCAAQSPYLEGVFADGVRPIYALQGAHLIEVLQPERVEVLVDSPECAERWGSGELASWFRLGHGVILDSVNHFDVQGLELATHLKKREERMAYALDHMGLSYERLRATRKERWWDSNPKAAREVRDLSVFLLVTNFVRLRRAAYGAPVR